MPANKLVNANHAARCQHVKVNGFLCGSPARRGRNFCCFHDSAARRNRDFVLPMIEDHASLQLALNRIMQALLDKRIDRRTAATLLYGLQIAFANLKGLQNEQRFDGYERSRIAAAQAARQKAEREQEENEKHVGSQSPITNHQSQNSPDHQITRSPDRPITIHACIDPDYGPRTTAHANALVPRVNNRGLANNMLDRSARRDVPQLIKSPGSVVDYPVARS